MKISVDGHTILELSQVQKLIIKNDIPEDIFEADMKRRLHYIINQPSFYEAKVNKLAIIEELSFQGKEVPSSLEGILDEFLKLPKHSVAYIPGFDSEDIVSVDGEEAFRISRNQKIVFAWLYSGKHREIDHVLDMQLKAQRCMALCWILLHKVEMCYDRLYRVWMPKLAERGIEKIPSKREDFARLVFNQPDYKDRLQRDLEQKLKDQRMRVCFERARLDMNTSEEISHVA